MNRFALAVVMIALAVSFLGGGSGKIEAWPTDKIENDLPYNPGDMPALIPLDVFEKQLAEQERDRGAYPPFPVHKWRGMRANYDLVAAQSPVKNQGKRGQCHNFATTAAMEYAVWAGEGNAMNFSEQCNAWKFHAECPMCNNDPEGENDGGYSDRELFFIHDKLMKFEEDFPYSDKDPSLCRTEYNDEPYYQFRDVVLYRQIMSQIKAAIDNKFVVVTSVTWQLNGWNEFGEYPYQQSYPLCTQESCGGHGVVIVGYDDDYFGKGKRGFIFKNSWSEKWAKAKGPKPAGYGVFPSSYLAKHGATYVAVSHKNVSPTELPGTGGCSGARRTNPSQ